MVNLEVIYASCHGTPYTKVVGRLSGLYVCANQVLFSLTLFHGMMKIARPLHGLCYSRDRLRKYSTGANIGADGGASHDAMPSSKLRC